MEKKSNKGIVIALLLVIAVLIVSITYMFVSGTVKFDEKNKDTIVLTEKKYAVTSGVAYKTYDMTEVIDGNCGTNCNKEEYFDKGATTKYTFRIAEDGSYYFESKVTNKELQNSFFFVIIYLTRKKER